MGISWGRIGDLQWVHGDFKDRLLSGLNSGLYNSDSWWMNWDAMVDYWGLMGI